MKQHAKTAGVVNTTPETKAMQMRLAIQWWALRTSRLRGVPFENPVAKIPKADSPSAPEGPQSQTT